MNKQADNFLRTLGKLPSNQLTLLITHNPWIVDQFLKEILPDKMIIVLAGHTHSGQLMLNSPLQKLAVAAGRKFKDQHSKYFSGLYSLGSSLINVNAGFGCYAFYQARPPAFDVFRFTNGKR